MVGLGRALGLSVTVEGVEGMEQVRLLREMDVQRGQGFALARPLSEVDLLAFLDRGPVPMPPRLHVVGERPDAVVPLATRLRRPPTGPVVRHVRPRDTVFDTPRARGGVLRACARLLVVRRHAA
ncbi:hypothetical protein GCM10025868_39770 [Angustibacter aerolatus]|uniref:EAL domain-containing protein n=1 Tax=Angustibacter aerolatus TaxID=1162965 RepID=A0ABQ6JPG1_9ACTN|nr:hypothetical protein GCM10025868_39770 [Angustibacter aerolatus]